MMHLDPRTLDALARDCGRVPRKAVLHVDACVACRRYFLKRGGSPAALAARLASARPRATLVAAAMALAVLGGATATVAPLRVAAASMLSRFEPHRVAAVPFTTSDMRSLEALPDLSAYASTRDLVRSSHAQFHDVRSASAAVRFAIREPSRAIPGLRPLGYDVQSGSAQWLTFDAAALPPDIAGTTLRVDLSPIVVTNYETAASAADRQRLRAALAQRAKSEAQQRHDGARTVIVFSRPGAHHVRLFSAGTRGQIDPAGLPLVVVQMPVPHVASTGASVQRLITYMLERPGVSPRLAAAFRALGDLSTTLPIPVPVDAAYTQPVMVDGVQGVGMGDDTGIGAAVIWQKNGMLYAVFAPRTARDVLTIANSLG